MPNNGASTQTESKANLPDAVTRGSNTCSFDSGNVGVWFSPTLNRARPNLVQADPARGANWNKTHLADRFCARISCGPK